MTSSSSASQSNSLVWDVDSTHPLLAEPLRKSLREVHDPEIGLSIIELGLVRNVTISENKALIKMILTTPYCPYAPALLEMAKKKAEEALGMNVQMEIGMEMWDFSMMEEGLGGEWGLF